MFFNFVTTNNAYIHESNFAKFRVVPRNVLVPQGHLIVKRETSVQIISMFSKHRVTGQQRLLVLKT